MNLKRQREDNIEFEPFQLVNFTSTRGLYNLLTHCNNKDKDNLNKIIHSGYKVKSF